MMLSTGTRSILKHLVKVLLVGIKQFIFFFADFEVNSFHRKLPDVWSTLTFHSDIHYILISRINSEMIRG